MKGKIMKRSIGVFAVAIGMTSNPVFAAGATLLPVLDVANFGINSSNLATNSASLAINTENLAVNVANAAENAISNGIQIAELMMIKQQLKNPDEGSVTYNINKNIAINTEINQEFTWIINNGEGGGEIIPIPFDLKKSMGEQSTADYIGHYKTVKDYEKDASGYYGDATAIEASRARKAANDALVNAIASDDSALKDEVEALKTLAEFSRQADGHGKQLQVANALSASQINQLLRLRSLTLVSEAARAAEAQATADREARATAVGIRLREGLDSALTHMKTQPAVY